MQIAEKVAVVTGGASGIGRATALALAAQAARAIVIADRDAEAAEHTAEAVRAHGGEALAVQVDVADVASLATALCSAKSRFGSVDILHNNAGISGGPAPWPSPEAKASAHVVDVNLRAVVVGTRTAIDLMRGAEGAIVNTASAAGLVPIPEQAVYGATKAAIVHFTKCCAELSTTHRVRVSCVCPGLVETDMVMRMDGNGPPAWLRPAIDVVKMLSPERVAQEVVSLICDPESGGKVVTLDNELR